MDIEADRRRPSRAAWIAVVILALVTAGGPVVPSYGDVGRSCGGWSPLIQSCDVVTTAPGDGLLLDTNASMEFVGWVHVEVVASAAYQRLECRYYTGTLAMCAEFMVGRFTAGEDIVIGGWVSGLVDGIPPAGDWSVAVRAS